MKLGLALPYDEAGVSVDAIRQLAQTAERLGFHSLWALERDVFPRAESYPRSADLSARDAARDPLSALAFAASGTERIAISLSIVNVPFHSPVMLATNLAALDRLSNGRVKLGVGAGYSEHECHGVASTLAKRTPASEFIDAFESLWNGGADGYQGDYFFIPKGVTIPTPVQSPSPPVSLVAFAPAAVLPSATLVKGDALTEPTALPRDTMAGTLNGMLNDCSVCPEQAGIAVRARIVATATPLGPQRAMFHGSREQIQSDIDSARARGVAELIVDLGSLDGDADLTWTLVAMQIIAEMAGATAPHALVASA